MKKIIISSISVIFSAFYLLAQPEKEIKAEMKQVTVFPDRAQINHESSVSLPTGKTVLKLSSLSPYIDPQSVQVKGFGISPSFR